MKFACCLLLTFLVSSGVASSVESGCRFLRDEQLVLPTLLKTVRIGNFAIHTNRPDLIAKQHQIIERSEYFLQTELGWKFPFSRKELGRPVLEVYFSAAGADFTGTVRPGPVVLLNENVLLLPDFSAIWIHYIAHASQMMYRPDGHNRQEDYWFYEATSAWMEGQFGKPDAATRLAQQTRRLRPQIPLDDSSPDTARGASLLLDLISHPYRDVIRQTWDQWSYSGEERVMSILDRVLQLNHLPRLKSYMMNYFLRAPFGNLLLNSTTNIVIQPYSAAVFQDDPGAALSGGVHLVFEPKKDGRVPDSAALIYHGAGEKEGILAIQESFRDRWSLSIPHAGMAAYRLVVVNASNQVVQGTLRKRFDSTIPAVMEYFRAKAEEEGGVLLEWKTARENGVAFWNVYRIQDGVKQRLNSLPIPASVDSSDGLHYMFVDYTIGAFYSLEALTGEGFPSPVATTTTQSIGKDHPDDP